MRLGFVIGACVAFTALAGCVGSDTQVSSKPNAGPGTQFTTPVEAGRIFAKACVLTEPTFKGAEKALLTYPITHSSTTGTYYHNSDNLSVKVHQGTCSLVFGANKSTDAVIDGLARGSMSVAPELPRDIDITSHKGPDGVTYFRLGLER